MKENCPFFNTDKLFFFNHNWRWFCRGMEETLSILVMWESREKGSLAFLFEESDLKQNKKNIIFDVK